MGLLETKVDLLVLCLFNLNLELCLHLVRILEGSDLHEAWVTKDIEPLELHLTKDFILEFVDLVVDWVLRLQDENE